MPGLAPSSSTARKGRADRHMAGMGKLTTTSATKGVPVKGGTARDSFRLRASPESRGDSLTHARKVSLPVPLTSGSPSVERRLVH